MTIFTLSEYPLQVRKTQITMKSGLSILFELAKELNLLGHVPQKCVQKDPFWNLKHTAFVSDLTSLKKEDTPAEIYRKMFTEITDNLKK